MPEMSINLHLGLSPWYRGSATLFWPFYNLQPHWAGATLHKIVSEPDAGDILHHVMPKLEEGDTIHDVGAKVVIQSGIDIVKIISMLEKGNNLAFQRQKSSGKNFLIRDFEPHHLSVIYDLYDDKIVDQYLEGKLGNRLPNLVKAFN